MLAPVGIAPGEIAAYVTSNTHFEGGNYGLFSPVVCAGVPLGTIPREENCGRWSPARVAPGDRVPLGEEMAAVENAAGEIATGEISIGEHDSWNFCARKTTENK